MNNEAMMNRAKQLVVNYFNAHVDVTDGKKLTMEDVFIVWFSKTLQNWKALVTPPYPMGCITSSPTMATRTRPIWMPTRSGTTSVSRTKEQLWTAFSLL